MNLSQVFLVVRCSPSPAGPPVHAGGLSWALVLPGSTSCFSSMKLNKHWTCWCQCPNSLWGANQGNTGKVPPSRLEARASWSVDECHHRTVAVSLLPPLAQEPAPVVVDNRAAARAAAGRTVTIRHAAAQSRCSLAL